MEVIVKILLLPFTLLYNIGVRYRNLLFDIGIKSSKSYSFPVISIGNLSVGGTGKTPHAEYIIKELKDKFALAVLSRGYGRKTKGFRLAEGADNAESIGDEPFQIFSKFPKVMVAVDEKRRRGIDTLKKLPSPPEIILLDDAFQHRQVKAGLSILLTDYSKLYINDLTLPSGRLREPRGAARRADIIVITKSPTVLSPLEIRRITSDLKPKDYQKVFFSYINYKKLLPLNDAAKEIEATKNKLSKHGVLLVSAIANPKPLLLHLKRHAKEIESFSFSDHHFFNKKDYSRIRKKLETLLSLKKVIVITEKDAVKFDVSEFGETPIFSIPINIKFHQHQEESFINEIEKYVRSYTTKH